MDEPATSAANAGQKKILLVEDDDNLANVYLTRLKAEGFDVKRVPNGEDALATAMQYHPDLIVLDVMMPKVSGFDVLDILRNTPETRNIKVVMLTALSQESDKQRADTLGADDYLVKSQVVIADVIARIKHHLGLDQDTTGVPAAPAAAPTSTPSATPSEPAVAAEPANAQQQAVATAPPPATPPLEADSLEPKEQAGPSPQEPPSAPTL